MRDDDEELVYERGQCWVGDEKYSARTFFALLRCCAIRADSNNEPGSGVERYTINETGRVLLGGDDGKSE